MGLVSKQNVQGEIVWGEYIEPILYCKKHVMGDECKRFHESIKETGRFSECPFGISLYKTNEDILFFSMRAKGVYKKGKHKAGSDQEYNPALSEESLLKLIEAECELDRLIAERESEKKARKSLRHEIKHLNGQIKEISDDLMQSFCPDETDYYTFTQDELKKIFEKIRTIFVSSSMIMSRYTLDDYENHSKGLYGGGQFQCTVYKKFDKVRKILRNYENKGIQIEMEGNSYASINAYSSFEFIPLLIVENAVKYSENGSSIRIIFDEKNLSPTRKLVVTVSSYGPYCDENEIKNIFLKDYRGDNAKRIADGSGLGLYFVKLLCDLHKINVSARSYTNNKTYIKGIPYAIFDIKLEFTDFY